MDERDLVQCEIQIDIAPAYVSPIESHSCATVQFWVYMRYLPWFWSKWTSTFPAFFFTGETLWTFCTKMHHKHSPLWNFLISTPSSSSRLSNATLISSRGILSNLSRSCSMRFMVKNCRVANSRGFVGTASYTSKQMPTSPVTYQIIHGDLLEQHRTHLNRCQLHL